MFPKSQKKATKRSNKVEKSKKKQSSSLFTSQQSHINTTVSNLSPTSTSKTSKQKTPQKQSKPTPPTLTTSLISTTKRHFRIGNTLGLSATSTPTKSPYSISSRFRKNNDDNDDDDYDNYLTTSEEIFDVQGEKINNDENNDDRALFVPIEAENGVVSPRMITNAVNAAIKKYKKDPNAPTMTLDPSNVNVLTLDEVKELFSRKDNSDFEGIDPTELFKNWDKTAGKKSKKYIDIDSIPDPTPVNQTAKIIKTESDDTTASTTGSITATTAQIKKVKQQQAEVMNLLDLSRQRLSSLSAPDIVSYLDSHVIAQEEAKKALAVAVRNRERRFRLQNLAKPTAISNIEEIGIRLAQKYNYTLRQELFEQIGRPSLPGGVVNGLESVIVVGNSVNEVVDGAKVGKSGKKNDKLQNEVNKFKFE